MTCSSPSAMNYRLSNLQKSYCQKLPRLSVLWTNFYCRLERWWGIWTPSSKNVFVSSRLLVQNWHVWAPTKPARLSPVQRTFMIISTFPSKSWDRLRWGNCHCFHILYNSLLLNVPPSRLWNLSYNRSCEMINKLVFQFNIVCTVHHLTICI